VAVQCGVIRDVLPDDSGRIWQRIQTLDGPVLTCCQFGSLAFAAGVWAEVGSVSCRQPGSEEQECLRSFLR
jgi:hypothetical protein